MRASPAAESKNNAVTRRATMGGAGARRLWRVAGRAARQEKARFGGSGLSEIRADVSGSRRSHHGFDRLAEPVHRGRAHAGDVDAAIADHVDRVLVAQLLHLILGQAGEAE